MLDNPNSAEAWFNFLNNEEAVAKQEGDVLETGAELKGGGEVPAAKAGVVGLYHLYHRATELVQRSKGRPLDAYVKIWVGYARHQWCV